MQTTRQYGAATSKNASVQSWKVQQIIRNMQRPVNKKAVLSFWGGGAVGTMRYYTTADEPASGFLISSSCVTDPHRGHAPGRSRARILNPHLRHPNIFIFSRYAFKNSYALIVAEAFSVSFHFF